MSCSRPRRRGPARDPLRPGDSMAREASPRQLAPPGGDPVFGIGFMFTDDVTQLAKESPKQRFACVDYTIPPGAALPPNLAALTFKEQEGSFLVGALAA